MIRPSPSALPSGVLLFQRVAAKGEGLCRNRVGLREVDFQTLHFLRDQVAFSNPCRGHLKALVAYRCPVARLAMATAGMTQTVGIVHVGVELWAEEQLAADRCASRPCSARH